MHFVLVAVAPRNSLGEVCRVCAVWVSDREPVMETRNIILPHIGPVLGTESVVCTRDFVDWALCTVATLLGVKNGGPLI